MAEWSLAIAFAIPDNSPMGDVWTYVLLCLSAFAAGVMNVLAGGGTLLTFPALTVTLIEKQANITSTVALVPGSLAGAWGMRRYLAGTQPWLFLLLPPALLGGALGAWLLILLPASYFALLVPWLLLTAALLYLVQPYLARALTGGAGTGLPATWLCVVVVFFQFLVAIYGGYFGAGIGILMISVLSLMGLGEIHRVNAVKNVLVAAINGISVVVFLFSRDIIWPYALVMAVTAILGGLSGARLGSIIPRWSLRWTIILIGLGLSLYYFLKQSGSGPV